MIELILPEASSKRPDFALIDSSSQRQILPLALVSLDPAPVKGRHNCGLGWAGDGQSYFLKGQMRGRPLVPVNELVCYLAAARVGIAVPAFEIIENTLHAPHAAMLFGSRRVYDVVDDPLELVQIFKGAKKHPELDRATSELFALDLFLNNADRHPENLLLQQSTASDYRLTAIDFSCAFLVNGLPSVELTQPKNSKTQSLLLALRRYGRFDQAAAISTLDKLDALPSYFVQKALTQTPVDWIDDQTARQVHQWWTGPTAVRHARLQAIRRWLENAA